MEMRPQNRAVVIAQRNADNPYASFSVEAVNPLNVGGCYNKPDASKLAAAGIPSIIFGPGDIAQAHTKDEFIALTDLEAGTAAYTDLTLKLLH